LGLVYDLVRRRATADFGAATVTEQEKEEDLDTVEIFRRDFVALCRRHGVLVHPTTETGYGSEGGESSTDIFVLVGSSKPAEESDLNLNYRGRK
jgi:hypothetical protein